MYKGKEACQGCKIPGDIKFRYQKNDLCEDCKKAFAIGSTVRKEELIEYVFVIDWYNGYADIDWKNREHGLDELSNEILSILDNPTADTNGIINSPRAQGLGSANYKIPKLLAQPIMDFFISTDKKITELKGIKEKAEEEARKAVSVEKNRIFNEGVEKGRELLFSLNNGDLTMEDFNKKITKY